MVVVSRGSRVHVVKTRAAVQLANEGLVKGQSVPGMIDHFRKVAVRGEAQRRVMNEVARMSPMEVGQLKRSLAAREEQQEKSVRVSSHVGWSTPHRGCPRG